MRIAIGSDERTPFTDHLVARLQATGHETILHGPLAGGNERWAEVAAQVARQVAEGLAEQGVLCCWTGTGVALAAAKVRGARPTLCADAETARGARAWNDANILCLSLRLTSPAVADEILQAWLSTPFDESERPNLELVRRLEEAR